MNVALPALVIFLVLLPGFIFRARLKRAERTSLDYSPFGQVAAEAVLWAAMIHMLWLAAAYVIFEKQLDAVVLLKLVSSDSSSQAKATETVGTHFSSIATYFVTILFGSYAMPQAIRAVISRYRLDRITSPISPLVRFHGAPWYYLLTGADFEASKEPDMIIISAIVEIAGEAMLYTGYLDEFFVDAEGQLDRLVLQEVMRRPIKADKEAANPEAWYDASRFYPVEGDYFVLRYNEAITLNIQYIQLRQTKEAS
jgi:hypothetical protein